MLRALLRALALALPLAASLAQAQSWPVKPVRAILNVAPGGVADVTMRVLAPKLSDALGQQVIVENRPGGDGYIGFEAVMRSDPDGYTLLYSPGSNVMILPNLTKRTDIDPVKAFIPIAPTGRVSLYVMVHPKLPIQNYPELLGYARANPGKLNYGTPATASSPHIAIEVWSREARVKMNHIPYKGAGPALTDLLGGVIDLTFDPGIGLQHARSGKLRMIAIAGPTRHPDFPDVPTVEEYDVKGVDGGPHFGLYAPAGTPRPVVDRLNKEMLAAMKDPAVLARFKALAVDLAPAMSPAAFGTYVRNESARYAKLLKELNISGDAK